MDFMNSEILSLVASATVPGNIQSFFCYHSIRLEQANVTWNSYHIHHEYICNRKGCTLPYKHFCYSEACMHGRHRSLSNCVARTLHWSSALSLNLVCAMALNFSSLLNTFALCTVHTRIPLLLFLLLWIPFPFFSFWRIMIFASFNKNKTWTESA